MSCSRELRVGLEKRLLGRHFYAVFNLKSLSLGMTTPTSGKIDTRIFSFSFYAVIFLMVAKKSRKILI